MIQPPSFLSVGSGETTSRTGQRSRGTEIGELPTVNRRIRHAALLLASALLVGSSNASAQCVSLTTAGSAYQQNFDTLSNVAGSTTNNLTIPGWFLTESGGGARDNEQYAVDTGGSNTGDTYSYGAAGSTERALGGLRSGTLIPIFGACFTNNTGTTIASLTIGYTGEEWRLGTAARTDQINFEYSVNATDLVTGTWNGLAALDFVTPDTVTTGAKDGNAAADRTVLMSTITSLSIANGTTFWIRWTDTDATGADDGLAVDDFSLTPQDASATATATESVTDTPTATPTDTPTGRPTGTPTATPTNTPQAENGQPCTIPGQCLSIQCVDRVCCDTACTAPNHTCNLPGREGTCLPITAAPAPALSGLGKIVGLGALLLIAGVGLRRRLRHSSED